MNSKWITNLNVKWRTIKFLEDNRGKNLDDLGYSDAFLDKDTICEKNIDKLDFVKIKNFCSVKDNIKRIRRLVTDWE